ncbi:type I-E CRISPR-associated protein Cas6/Cse3/CasE [Acidomonas methanolica]|uniref:CRISPR-associated protein n=1 Tax=Acidomonas methanolica NBRC 104435 TaxID=1231351 RepID=A0A023D2M8_ACIMT|nr:type I-E CRISPR-associated protein Cas6/Cse3/CasE [Acidomonas methanolica]TCS21563.1 CRISPR system Cascade subunit CasE [Acidomonas methanolica]GAJ28392.1 CRISPR-associated protein [Acidomonas methanolica NBRC 104435]GBQ45848.1 CRISPR-associated Cse3 family protein [Acidomonas methanolica]GEL00388.1 hypothetical protein AME01nite_28860 [Acidomonas methanolica NBRC 104435]
MTLSMLRLPVSTAALFESGLQHGLVRDSWSVDTGYLVHALFARLFGESAPKPFDVQQDPSGIGKYLWVLAYAPQGHQSLEATAAGHQAIAWDQAASKPMPVLADGQEAAFRLRVCPVVRVGRQHPRFAPGAEVDPYVALVQRHVALAGPFADEPAERQYRQAIIAELPSREEVYREWLDARIGGAARLQAVRLASLSDARLWRKGEPGEGVAARMHGHARARRGSRSVIGRREAVFEGTLRVADRMAFAALLARGVGRHRAFGFGMLLLRSARTG